ncbi:hypothetical protein BDV25DRAFT_159282 [Aspergillus avenaceus]|uniref:Uncharacterized protein n=1 Tax=Aspergillus avenaceus TaxID=36643 RepID=A0A5N6TP96_ASPAV|nr:hypothetical protein BDV25DRAFT_159282 [Aspergillus avenaceus]
MSSNKFDVSRIVRILRSDDPGSYVLLQVTPVGPGALDLDIAATEGENPYSGSVRHSRLRELCNMNYQGEDREWAQIVSYVFDCPEESAAKSDLLPGIESSASVVESADGESMELIITIRKRIQSITQRLGSLILKQDDEQAIHLFEWSGVAVARMNAVEQRFYSLLARYRSAEDTIKQLNKQLEDFIYAKDRHEDQILVNLVQLLNEKKLKIRNQQRILASANVDVERVSEIQDATLGRHCQLSGKGKQAKSAFRGASNSEFESEDGFDEMQVDQKPRSNEHQFNSETEDEKHSIPQSLEEIGADTTSEEGTPASLAEASSRSKTEKSKPNGSYGRSIMEQTVPHPPRRVLPFANRTQSSKIVLPQAQQQEDLVHVSTGETDDDEL